jgi:hypothetical protein
MTAIVLNDRSPYILLASSTILEIKVGFPGLVTPHFFRGAWENGVIRYFEKMEVVR